MKKRKIRIILFRKRPIWARKRPSYWYTEVNDLISSKHWDLTIKYF
jgi:hypothetical protein